MSGVPFFLRLDDIAEMDSRAVHLVEGALSAGLPVLVAVIPAQLTQDTATWLLQLSEKHAPLLDIGQHGFRHEDYLQQHGWHGEFCRLRTRAEQAEDLKMGMAIMDDLLGERWQRIFVPPFNHLTRGTVDLLVGMAYRGLSTIHIPPRRARQHLSATRRDWAYRAGGFLPAHRNGYRVEGRLPCVSPVLDMVADYGSSSPRMPDELDERVEELLSDGIAMLGIMLHHWVYRDVADADVALQWLRRTAERYDLKPVPVSRLLEGIS